MNKSYRRPESCWDEPIVHVPPSRSRFKYWSNQSTFKCWHEPSAWDNLPKTKSCYSQNSPSIDRFKDRYDQNWGSWPSQKKSSPQFRKPRRKSFQQKNWIEPVPSSELFETPIYTAIRSGVIPYAYHQDKLYWLIGITPGSKWSDFGGGCKTKMKETPANALIREVDEESSGILTEIITTIMQTNPDLIHVWRARNRCDPPIYRYLSFIEIPYFNYNQNFISNREVSRLIWIPQEVLLEQTSLDRFHEPLIPYIRYFRTHLNLSSIDLPINRSINQSINRLTDSTVDISSTEISTAKISRHNLSRPDLEISIAFPEISVTV